MALSETARAAIARTRYAKAFAPAKAAPEVEATPAVRPTLDQVIRDHVELVLRAHDGNISRAAAELGMYRSSLQRKLKKWHKPRASVGLKGSAPT